MGLTPYITMALILHTGVLFAFIFKSMMEEFGDAVVAAFLTVVSVAALAGISWAITLFFTVATNT